MSSSSSQVMQTYFADGAIPKGSAVKIGTDKSHVALCTAVTDKSIGIAQTASTVIEDAIEVAIGGGCKGLLSGTVSAGMLLTATTDGSLIVVASAGNRVIARAMQSGVAADMIGVEINVCQAYAAES